MLFNNIRKYFKLTIIKIHSKFNLILIKFKYLKIKFFIKLLKFIK